MREGSALHEPHSPAGHPRSVDPAHLPRYLDEFVFRFNRRRSASRGPISYRVVELAVAHDPVRYRDPRAPSGAQGHPAPAAQHSRIPAEPEPPTRRPTVTSP